MKTDTIFYRLFQSFPGIFFELIQLPAERSQAYRFDSVEVKQLAFRVDGVFLPHSADTEMPIYFTEVQFQADNQFYGRFLAEIFLYLSKTTLENDWRGVVIYPSRQVESSNIKRYRELLESGRIKQVYLDELGDLTNNPLGIATIQLIVSQDQEAISATRQLVQRVKQELTDPQNQAELLQLIETILIYKLPRLTRQEIEAMFTVDELKQTRYFQDVLEEGRQEGRQEGQQEGELRGKLAAVPLMLQLGATVEQIAETLNLPLERVQEIQLNP